MLLRKLSAAERQQYIRMPTTEARSGEVANVPILLQKSPKEV
jgi:hypothetical protein